MDKNLTQYIKDITTCSMIAKDKNDEYKGSIIKLHKRFLKAIKNYATLRLKILQNEKVKEIEHKALTAAMKYAIKYAIKEYQLDVGTTDTDKIVDAIMPEVLDSVHNLRVDFFTSILEFTTGRLNESR